MKNSWGLYHWFTIDGDEFIHPQDYEKFKELSPYGKVFQCIDQTDQYIVLRYRDEIYRVKPELYKIVADPFFNFGDKVQAKNRSDRIGTVTEIKWHYRKNAPMYFIIDNRGRRVSKRYFDGDLMKLK